MVQPGISLSLFTQVPRLKPRPVDGNKGTFGRVLIVAGSRGMTGAAVLAGSAALRGGAGLVFVAVAEGLLPFVASANPCYLTVPLPGDENGRLGWEAMSPLLDQARQATVTVLGPGLGQSESLAAVVGGMVSQVAAPMVLDADALNLLARQQHLLHLRVGPTIVTPHPGEFGRLVGKDIASVQADRQNLAADFARKYAVIVVLKGHQTVVTDGQHLYVNSTGNPGMATGGTGDVLSGLIGALLAQGQAPFAAASLGAYLHGLAGDLARDALGETSLIASDLLTYLPVAFRSHAG
jgi:NAD(P)H-hydrate epimerase